MFVLKVLRYYPENFHFILRNQLTLIQEIQHIDF